jgi:hypothetical protein
VFDRSGAVQHGLEELARKSLPLTDQPLHQLRDAVLSGPSPCAVTVTDRTRCAARPPSSGCTTGRGG